MNSFAVLSLFILASAAQSSNQSNPFIPSGISSNCSTFLNDFNNNASFTSCTNPITSVASQFGPGASSSNTGSSSVNTTLNQLCSSTAFTGCPDSTIRAQLMSFYLACSAELTTNVNTDVLRTYDVLYSITPFRQAICSTSENGQYCAAQMNCTSSNSGTGTGTSSSLTTSTNSGQQYLYTSLGLSDGTTAMVPNVTTYQDTNLLFLFLQASMPTSQLCTICTRSILTSYILFESSLPYAPGLVNSLLLSSQPALYNATVSKCPSGFMNGAVEAAGSLGSAFLSSGAPHSIGADVSLLVIAILGGAGLAMAAF